VRNPGGVGPSGTVGVNSVAVKDRHGIDTATCPPCQARHALENAEIPGANPGDLRYPAVLPPR